MADEKTKYTTAEIASLFGLTPRRVQQLTAEGILEAETVGKTRKYDLASAVRNYIRHVRLTESQTSEEDENLERKRLKAEAKYKTSKAGIVALQLRELEGKMHRSEDVEAMTADLVLAVRGMLLALPGRLAIDLAPITNAAEISQRMRAEICAVLERLAEYQYDPEKYAQRVRERQGWDVTGDDGS